MSVESGPPGIVVFGASGLVGGRVAAALDSFDVPFVVAGRRKNLLDKVAALVGATDVRVADANDEGALARAFTGAKVVVNCANPLAELGEPVLLAALAAGAHYVDLGGDQAFIHAVYERHDSTARHAGKLVVPGCGVNCALGDWGAAWAAAYVCGMASPGAAGARSTPQGSAQSIDVGTVVRASPAPRIGEDEPLDEVAVSYIYDDLVLSPGSQKAVFGNLHTRGLAWRRDRWETQAPAAERKHVNAGPEMGGVRDAASFPGGDVITVPRHIDTHSVQTYVSTTRNAVASTALRLFARALPFVPKKVTSVLAPYQPTDDEYARTQFAVIAQARRGFTAGQVVMRGYDQYRASAGIAAWVARELAQRPSGPIGIRAPSELFRAEAAIRAVAPLIDLRVEPSFA